MRITIRKIRGVKYVYLHESYRDPKTGKPKHKTIRSYGRLDVQLEADPDFLENLRAEVEAMKASQDGLLTQATLNQAHGDGSEKSSGDLNSSCVIYNYGKIIYDKILGQLLPTNRLTMLTAAERKKLSFNALAEFGNFGTSIVSDESIVSGHSKEPYFKGQHSIKEEEIVKLLTLIGRRRRELCDIVNESLASINPNRNGRYVFDLYPRSALVDPSTDDLIRQDYTLGLVTDEHFLPIAYREFSPSHPPSKDFTAAFTDKYTFSQLTTITDRGLRNPEKLETFSNLSHETIFIARIAGSSEGLLDDYFLKNNFELVNDSYSDTLLYRYKPLKANWSDGLAFGDPILYFSPKLRTIDQFIREQSIQSRQTNCVYLQGGAGRKAPIEPMLLNCGELATQRYSVHRTYFDGFRLVFSTNPTISPKTLAKVNSNHWQALAFINLIQSGLMGFRSISWTREHMNGAFLTFLTNIAIQLVIEYKTQAAGLTLGREEIIRLIYNASVTVYRQNDTLYFLKTKTHPMFDQLGKLFGLAPLNTFETADSISKKLGVSIKDLQLFNPNNH